MALTPSTRSGPTTAPGEAIVSSVLSWESDGSWISSVLGCKGLCLYGVRSGRKLRRNVQPSCAAHPMGRMRVSLSFTVRPPMLTAGNAAIKPRLRRDRVMVLLLALPQRHLLNLSRSPSFLGNRQIRKSADSQVYRLTKLQFREHGRGRIGLVENIAEEL